MESTEDFTDEELLAYIDERLPIERSTELERQLRSSVPLLDRLGQLIRNTEHGEMTIGAMWRRGRWSCPSRPIWAGYLSGRLGDALSQYLRFHLETIGCRTCDASLRDLARTEDFEGEVRVRKIFQSSAGSLRPLGQD